MSTNEYNAAPSAIPYIFKKDAAEGVTNADLNDDSQVSREESITNYNMMYEFYRYDMNGDLFISAIEMNEYRDWTDVLDTFKQYDTAPTDNQLSF